MHDVTVAELIERTIIAKVQQQELVVILQQFLHLNNSTMAKLSTCISSYTNHLCCPEEQCVAMACDRYFNTSHHSIKLHAVREALLVLVL